MASTINHDAIFAKNVRALRERQGLSQEKLSLKADQHPRYIAQVENEKRGVTLRAALRVAQALGVELAELIGTPRTIRTSPARARIDALLRDRADDDLAVVERVIRALYPSERIKKAAGRRDR